MEEPFCKRADLSSRADVAALLHRFYGRVMVDDVLAAPFSELRAKGLESHIPRMCDFWETVLFRAGLYHGSALDAHRHVHSRVALSGRYFVRWLTTWNSCVDASVVVGRQQEDRRVVLRDFSPPAELVVVRRVVEPQRVGQAGRLGQSWAHVVGQHVEVHCGAVDSAAQ